MFTLVKLVLGVVIVFIVVGLGRTWQLEHSENQKLFLKGIAHNKPNGFYRGSVADYAGRWQGKKFDAKKSKGINVFKETTATKDAYPFATSVGKGVHDTELDVIKIDYDTPENPFWMRPIIDEIVETSPGNYLGKLHVRIIPGYPFTLAFFELKK